MAVRTVHYHAKTYDRGGKEHVLRGSIDLQPDNNMVSKLAFEIKDRLKKPHLWHGVGIDLTLWNNKKMVLIFNDDVDCGYVCEVA